MDIPRLAAELRDYAGFGPGVLVALLVSLATCGYVSARLGISRTHGWALVMSLGVVLAATITPSRDALLFGALGSGTCDLGRIGFASWGELTHLGDASLNVLLFVPLGFALGACPRSPKLVFLAGALVLPAAVELLQLEAVSLGRECESADAIDNLTGLVLGVVAGSVAGWLSGAMARRSR